MNKSVGAISLLFLKHTPQDSKLITSKLLEFSKLQQLNQKQLYAIERYITSLQTHKEYLQFFQIGVVRDQKKKIQNVAKYVGLAIRGIDDKFEGQIVKNNEKNVKQ